MKLFTQSILNKVAKRPFGYTTDNPNAKAICKIFNPYGYGTWWIFEGEKLDNGDWEFFGIAEITEREFGYFRLSELQNIRLNVFGYPMPLERDLYYTPQTKEEIMNYDN